MRETLFSTYKAREDRAFGYIYENTGKQRGAESEKANRHSYQSPHPKTEG